MALLRGLFLGKSLRRMAREQGRALSTLHERAERLRGRGLAKSNRKRGEQSWQVTGGGLRVLRAASGGGVTGDRTPLIRAHRLVVRGELLKRPPDEVLHARLPGGWASHAMRGWVKHHGQLAVEEVRVKVQVRLRSVVFYVPELPGDPVEAMFSALGYAEAAAAALRDCGVEVGQLKFEGNPEVAFPDHPVARAYGRVGHLIPGVLWVDKSDGETFELETNDLVMAAAIGALPYRGEDVHSWVGAVAQLARRGEVPAVVEVA